MPVSGLVVVLSEDQEMRRSAIGAMQQQPAITLGDQLANRLAVVLDTESKSEDQQMWNWLHSLSGVAMVELVFVGFEELDRLDELDREVPREPPPGYAEGSQVAGSP